MPVCDPSDRASQLFRNMTQNMVSYPINMRLGTPMDWEVMQIFSYLEEKNISIGDVITIPEQVSSSFFHPIAC
jgi:hypothetical protein